MRELCNAIGEKAGSMGGLVSSHFPNQSGRYDGEHGRSLVGAV